MSSVYVACDKIKKTCDKTKHLVIVAQKNYKIL